jgi:hypothetical protein
MVGLFLDWLGAMCENAVCFVGTHNTMGAGDGQIDGMAAAFHNHPCVTIPSHQVRRFACGPRQYDESLEES